MRALDAIASFCGVDVFFMAVVLVGLEMPYMTSHIFGTDSGLAFICEVLHALPFGTWR